MNKRTSDQFHCILGAVWLLGLWAPMALAQDTEASDGPSVPVFTDDSPQAIDNLSRAGTHLDSGNVSEALRMYQFLLDELPLRLVGQAGTAENTFVSVRRAVHDVLRSEPDLWSRYVVQYADSAQRVLHQGRLEVCWRSFFLTPAGLEATLLLAQRELVHGRFESAGVLVRQARNHPALDDGQRGLVVQLGAWIAAGRGGASAGMEVLDGATVRDLSSDELDRLRGELRALTLPRTTPAVRAIDPLRDAHLQDLGGSPTWRHVLREEQVGPDEVTNRRRTFMEPEPARDPSNGLAIMPTVASDLVCITDGLTLRALDRFDGRQRWEHEYAMAMARSPGAGRRIRSVPDQNDPAMPLIDDHRVLAIMTGFDSRSDGASLLVCHNLDSGALMWSRWPDELHSDLDGAQFVGFPVSSQGRLFLLARKQTLRLASDFLVAIDIETGEHLWHQHLASAAIMGFYATLPAVAPTVDRGAVFLSSPLGAMVSVDARSGEVQWLRLSAPITLPSLVSSQPAWAFDTPVIHGERIVQFTPDFTRIVALDRQSGATVAMIPSAFIADPKYVLGNDDGLWAVGERPLRLEIVNGGFEVAPLHIPWRRSEELVSRVSVGEGQLLLPTTQRLILTRTDGTISSSVEVHSPAIPLLVGGEVLLASHKDVEAYIPFEIGQPQLRRRLEENPNDPNPAISLARLAFQHRRFDELLSSVDLAMDIIEDNPRSEQNTLARERLFSGILDMAPNAALASDLSSSLYARLDLLATTTSQRVAYLLGFGDHLAQAGRPAGAVEAYQSILALPALGFDIWTENGTARRARDVATDRIAKLIAQHGQSLYEPYEVVAQRRWDALGPAPAPAAALDLAHQFPFSRHAPAACLLAARSLEDRGEAVPLMREEAIASLQLGRALAQTANIETPELTSALLTTLMDAGRIAQAARLARTIQRVNPDAMIPSDREAVGSIDQWIDWIAEIAQRRGPLPSLGQVGELADIRDGERLLIPNLGPPPTDVTLVRDGRNLIGYDAQGAIEFIELLDSNNKEVLTAHEDHVILASLSSREPRTVERFSLDTYEMEWTTPSFDDFFPPGAPGGSGRLVPAVTEVGIVLTEEYGRLASINHNTGQLQWSEQTPIDQVRFVSSQAFAVVVAGEELMPGDRRGRRETSAHHIIVLDAHTGDQLLSIENDAFEPFTHVQLSEDGLLVYISAEVLYAIDIFTGSQVWTLNAEDFGQPLWMSAAGSSLLVFDLDGLAHLIDLRSGRKSRLEAIAPLERGESLPELRELGDRFLLHTHNGIYILEDDGAVTGKMIGSGDPNVTVNAVARAADRIVVLLSLDHEGGRNLPRTSQIAQLDLTGRNLDLPFELDERTESPRAGGLQVLDGAIIVDAGRDVIFIPAPTGELPNS